MAKKLNSSEMELSLLRSVAAGVLHPEEAALRYTCHLAGAVKRGQLSAASANVQSRRFRGTSYEVAVGWQPLYG